MLYVGDQVTQCQRDTNNVGGSSTSGIDPEDFLRYLNWGQESAQALISATNPQAFRVQQEISLVADQEAYSITSARVYLGERVVNVEYSPTGQARDYYKIYEIGESYRKAYPQADPINYVRRWGQILLQPPPTQSTGKIRVTFEKQVDTLDTRRGRVNGTPTGAVIDLTHGTFGAPSAATEALLVAGQYVCIVDSYGTVLLQNGVISSYNSSNDELTLAANVNTYTVGATTLASLADGYLTVGKWTTTHSQLSDICERYIMLVCNRYIYERDSKNATNRNWNQSLLDDAKNEMLACYRDVDSDEDEIQISNPDLLL